MCGGKDEKAQTGVGGQAQLNVAMYPRPARDAGVALARLMERQLGYAEGHIDNIALRLFIRAHWNKVSALAHTIHEYDE